MQILLIDDHTLFRSGMGLLLAELMPALVITQVGSCEQAIDESENKFSIVVMDWHMPGLYGFEALELLKTTFPLSALVVLSGEESPALIRKIMEAGASGFIPKSSEPTLMVGALQLVLAKGVYLPPQAFYTASSSHQNSSPTGLQSDGLPIHLQKNLTQRQIEILKMALKGVSNKLIGRELGISDGTVKAHLSTVYRVMSVRNRTEALYAIAKKHDG